MPVETQLLFALQLRKAWIVGLELSHLHLAIQPWRLVEILVITVITLVIIVVIIVIIVIVVMIVIMFRSIL